MSGYLGDGKPIDKPPFEASNEGVISVIHVNRHKDGISSTRGRREWNLPNNLATAGDKERIKRNGGNFT